MSFSIGEASAVSYRGNLQLTYLSGNTIIFHPKELIYIQVRQNGIHKFME